MSFISILKTIAGVEHAVAPLLSMIPGVGTIAAGVDAIVWRIQGAMQTAEVQNPSDGQGGLKAAAVISDFKAALEFTQQVLALEHKKMEWDNDALKAAIDAQTAAYNAFAKLKASFKVSNL